MNHLYAPWRSSYLKAGGSSMCLFCEVAAEQDDRKNMVVARAAHWYIIVNRFPYTTGHIMVVCNRHLERFSELREDESRELMELLSRGERALVKAYAPDGINVGANLGRTAGAGVVGHLHVHLVPRWQGDTNFMSTIGDTRVVSEGLDESYDRLRSALRSV